MVTDTITFKTIFIKYLENPLSTNKRLKLKIDEIYVKNQQ